MLDSCFIFDLANGEPGAIAKAQQLERDGGERYLATPVLYELLTGLYYRGSKTEMSRLRRIVSRFVVLQFDEMAARMAAEVRAELLRLGQAAAPVDIMIAGIAMHHGHVLVTRDKRLLELDIGPHLEVEPY